MATLLAVILHLLSLTSPTVVDYDYQCRQLPLGGTFVTQEHIDPDEARDEDQYTNLIAYDVVPGAVVVTRWSETGCK